MAFSEYDYDNIVIVSPNSVLYNAANITTTTTITYPTPAYFSNNVAL
jgi:hypothetical protein